MPDGPSMFGMGDRVAMGGFQTPGPQNPTNELALSALGQIQPKSANPTAALMKLKEAYTLAHKLIMASLPQLAQWNSKAAKEAHAAARQILNIVTDLEADAEVAPPPDLMSGFGLGGSPGPMSPTPMSGPGM